MAHHDIHEENLTHEELTKLGKKIKPFLTELEDELQALEDEFHPMIARKKKLLITCVAARAIDKLLKCKGLEKVPLKAIQEWVESAANEYGMPLRGF